MALGLLVSNFYKFAQFFSQLFVSFFALLSCFDKTGKNEIFGAHTSFARNCFRNYLVCVLSCSSLPAGPEKANLIYLWKKEMMKNSADLENFSIRRISPEAHHACLQHCCAYISANELLREKLINYLIKYPTINIFNFLPSSPRWLEHCCFGHDKNKIIYMLIMQYKCISALAI